MNKHIHIVAAAFLPAQTSDQPPASNSGALASHSHIARVAGEAFDADQIGWTCDECDRDEYSCECDEADDEPSGWLLAEQSLTLGAKR